MNILIFCTILLASTISYAQPCQDSWVWVSKDGIAESGHESGQDVAGDVVDISKYEDKEMNENTKVHFVRYRACLTAVEIQELLEPETIDVAITHLDRVKVTEYQKWLSDADSRIINKVTQVGEDYLVDWSTISKEPARFRKRSLDIDKLKTKEGKEIVKKDITDNLTVKPDLAVAVNP